MIIVPADILTFNQIKMKSNWTAPKVARYDDPKKNWFVWFRYNGKLYKYKKGINYVKDLKKREKEASALCDSLYKKLKAGWSPSSERFNMYDDSLTLIEGARLGLEKKKSEIAPRTYEDYASAVEYLIEGIKAMSASYLLLCDTQRVHARQIMAKTKKIKGWSNKSYNKNLGYIKAVFSALIKWDVIKENPFHKIECLPEEVTEANITPTDKELALIKEKLFAEFPSYLNYVETIFHTGIRPEELLAVKLSMVDFQRNVIKLPPAITKTPIYRNVPMNKQLRAMFERMEISAYPKDYYLFGSTRQYLNKYISTETDFVIGAKMLNRDCASALWKKLIKDGLGISVNLYAMKHLGGDKKLLAGIDLDTVRHMYGHTNQRMTERYLKQLKEIYKNQIVDLSPDF